MHLDQIFPPKACSQCKKVKRFTAFGLHCFASDRVRSACKECESISNRKKRKANPRQKEIDRKYNLRFGFKMTVAEYDAMHAEQGGVCAICKRPETARLRGEIKRLAIDHCHVTGENRGLLCSKCNVAIGYFGESVKALESAIAYLHQHQTNNKTKELD